MKAFVIATALVSLSAFPALAECGYSAGKQQTVKVDSASSTQTASTKQSTPVQESSK